MPVTGIGRPVGAAYHGAENGSGSATSTAEYYDGRGRLRWESDGVGSVHVLYGSDSPTTHVDPSGLLERKWNSEVPGIAGGFTVKWSFALDKEYDYAVILIQCVKVRVEVNGCKQLPQYKSKPHWEKDGVLRQRVCEFLLLTIDPGCQDEDEELPRLEDEAHGQPAE